jgi:hypothetical protein
MKSAKIALVAAFIMTALNCASCLGLLLQLNSEANHTAPTPGEMSTPLQEQLQAALQEQFIHQHQIALHGEIAALAWNLLLAVLLIFSLSRIQKSK